MAAEVGSVVFQNEFRLGVFRPPGAEPFEVQLVVVHEVDVHVEPLCGVGFALAGRHKRVCALDAVHEAGTSQDHPLVDHPFERFVEADVSPVVQEFGPKTCVQQVPSGVLGPADVQVHLAPVIAFVAGAKLGFVVGVHVPKEVPTASRPTRHRVGLHGVALEHRPIFPRGTGQRRFAVLGGQVRVHFRKLHGGVGDALGHALLVLDGERFTPVALAAEDRVPDAVVDGSRPHALCFHPIDGQRDGVGGFHAVPFTASTEDGPLVGAHGFLRVDPLEDARDVQPEVRGEFPVPFVAGRHRHDGSRAVPGQDVIGDPHRNQRARNGVHHVPPREDPGDGFVALPIALGFESRGSDVGVHFSALCVCRELGHQAVFWREDHERHAVQGVWPGGEDFNFGARGVGFPLVVGHRKPNRGSL